MDYVSGELLTDSGIINGYLGFENNLIIEQGTGNSPKNPICKGLIVPSFVNSHTHIGDSFIRNKNTKLPKNVEELVGPPDGLKHKLLKEASSEEIVNGMKESLELMIRIGTSAFCDFRENGIEGIRLIKKALENKSISSCIFSRPNNLEYKKDEVEILLKNSNGVGISSISDWDYSELEKVAKHTKKEKKKFAIHASEAIREDIDLILNLKPDFLIHMTGALESDFIRVKDENIPVVLCPRSNAFFGLKPNFELIKKTGIEIILGTDNAMLNSPDVLDELRYLRSITDVFSIEEMLNMITYRPRKVLNLSPIILGSNSPANFVVLDKKTLKTLYISISR